MSRKYPHNFFDDAEPFKIEGVYCKLIPLTQGQFAIVDAADYESLSRFKWYANWNPMKHGFYAVRHHATPKGDRLEYMHRAVLGLPFGDPRESDHIDPNGPTTDNRRANLRIATDQEQQWNKGISSSNRTGVKGVSFDPKRKKYLVCISINGKTKNIGRRDTLEEARELRRAAELKYQRRDS